MNLHEFLSHRDVQLPLHSDWEDDFHGFLQKRLDRFCELITSLDAGSVADTLRLHEPAIRKCCASISRSVHSSLDGRLHEAYSAFDTGIRQVLSELRHYTMTLEPEHLGQLYRVRITQCPRLRREDLFHIPFEMRHKVPTDRYSIPGLPCLYLSGSLYTCWEEMGRPPFHELQAAAFWVKDGKSVKLLNFTKSPSRLLSWVKANDVAEPPTGGLTRQVLERQISASLVLWPLMASASVMVKHDDSPFKPEYLIPQMLLQWVTNNKDFDGICYFSTHVCVDSTGDALPACNLVFPPKVIRPSGRCEHLCSVFKMTEPYGWGLLKATHIGEVNPDYRVPNFDLELMEGVKGPYYDTEFAVIESKLDRLARHIVAKNKSGDPDLGDVRIAK